MFNRHKFNYDIFISFFYYFYRIRFIRQCPFPEKTICKRLLLSKNKIRGYKKKYDQGYYPFHNKPPMRII